MYTIGIDLHKRESQLCIQTGDGVFVERRIAATRERFTAVLAPYAPARVLLEAATESEWVARHLEADRHTVIVADPNFAPMYATRSRRVKTDKRDARTLCEACARGTYQSTHRLSEAQRHVRVEVAPLLALIAMCHTQIDEADDRLTRLAATSAPARLLQSMPMIGPVTALGFVAALDDIARFPSASHVAAYLGLVPSEYSSGERQQRGHITKRSDTRTRWLLVEAAWRICDSEESHRRPTATLDGADHRTARSPDRDRGAGPPFGDAVLRHAAHEYTVSRDSSAARAIGGGRVTIAPPPMASRVCMMR